MKKKMWLVLALALLMLAVSACGAKTETTEPEKTETTDAETTETEGKEETDAETAATPGGSMRWIVGLDDTFAPMGFRDDSGNIVGFDIDLANELGRRSNVEIVFQPIDWEMKENELNSGNIDVIWNGYSITPEREELVTLSDAYISNRIVLLVLDSSDIQTKEDLAGKVVAAQINSSGQTGFEANKDLMAIIKDQKLVTFPTYTEAMVDLKAGRTDVLSVDEVFIRYYLRQLEDGNEYRILEEGLQEEGMAVGMRKDDTARKEVLDKFFEGIKADGKYDEIYGKWFQTD